MVRIWLHVEEEIKANDMATLYFKVSSDWEQVVKLRQECEKLETQLKKMDVTKSPAAARVLETQLASTRQQMMGLVTEAAKAGAVMEHNLKNKLNATSKASDELTEEIIKQKKIIRDTQEDVRRLSEEYSKMGKYSPNSKTKLAELNAAKAALNEQRYSLGELQDQQARNRLEVRKLTREYKEFANGTNNADEIVKSLTDSLKRTAAEIGGLMAIKKFGSDVIEATGKMQQLQVALSTILQDKSKADTLLAEISQFAVTTQFSIDDVATGAKQLLAYGSTADKVVGELSMLGDIASGLQIPLGQLIYLYGTLKTQGRAMTVDIRQFAGRGIPIYEELAKVLGVSKDQVGELVKEGKVGFKEVEQAFKNMTSEGGKFNNMLANAAGTWPQQIAAVEEKLFLKLNEFGNKHKEIFEFGIGTAEDLVESLDDVLSVIGGLIAAYGTYKAALIAAAVAQKAVGFLESIRLISMYRKELGLATAAQQAFNVASKSNVYVALLAALVGIGTAIYMFTKRTNEATVAQETLNNVQEKADEVFSKQAATVDRLNSILKSETSSLYQKKKALSDLQSIIPSYNASLDEEGKLINNNTEAIQVYLTQLEKQIRLKAAQEELEELYRKKRVQEKDYKSSKENFEKVKKENPLGEFYGESGARLQLYTAQERSSAERKVNKAKEVLDETISAINALEKEIEKSSLSDKKESPQSTISKEVENATKRINTLKQEIADLRSGKIQAEVGKTVESAIKAKEKELKAANETLETLTGNKSQTTQQENSVSQQQSRLSEIERRQVQERIRQQIDLENQAEQVEIDALQDSAEKVKRQRNLDNKKELEAIDRQKEDYIERTIQAQKEIFDAKEKLKASKDKNYKIKEFDSSSVSVDTSIFDGIYSDTKEKQIIEGLQMEKVALNSYLQEYGTFQQRKYAIAQEYADKIAKAQTETEKLKLSKDRDNKVAAIEAESLKAQIDWSTVFGEFGGMFSDMIKPVLEEAKKYMQTDEFKNSDSSSQQVFIEAVNQMEKSIGGAGGLDFKKLGEDVKAYQNALLSLNEVKEEETEAIEKLKKAQEDYEKALKSGTETEKQSAKDALDIAQTKANTASENVQTQTNIVSENQRQVSDTSSKLKASMDNVIEGLQKISSGSLTSIYSGLIQAGKGIGGVAAKVSKSLENVPIIGWIVSIIDVFKDGLSNVVGGLLDAVLNAVSGIIGDVLSGDLLVTIGESLLKGISNIFDALTFGGFSKWVKNGDSDKDLEKDTDRLLESNENLRKSIDNLVDRMNESSLKDVNDIYNEQVDKLNQSIANTKELMVRNVDAYSNGFFGIGGHKSSRAKIGAGTSSEDWNRISEIVGYRIDSAVPFFSMSPEDMLKVFEQAPDLYSKIKALADDGYKDAAQYMDEYIDYAKQMEELDTQRKERLTSTTFDNVRDEFKSTLLDMESDAEDFANNFEKMMQNAAIESMMSNFDTQLKSWYDDFAEAMGEDGELSASEQEELKRRYENLVNRGLAERDALMEAMGWESETSKEQQSATSKGFEAMSQDTGEELNGRFTALQESGIRLELESQKQTVAITELKGSISGLVTQNQNLYNIADETRTILANSYLELQQIRENTEDSAKYLKDIKADIAEVKQNTSKL